jgi:molybdopterin molybdotransferase
MAGGDNTDEHDFGTDDGIDEGTDGGTDHDTDLWRAEAVAAVRDLRESVLADRGTETVGLAAIGGRTLAEAIRATEDRPARDRATMDGFAFDATAEYPFEIVSEVFPEDDPPEIEASEAVEIATGAPLPRSANAVLKHEEATVEGGQLSGSAIDGGAIRGDGIDPGTHVYRQGHNVAADETLFEAGEGLSPKDAVLLRDLDVEDVPVYERLSAGVLATGTEIHEGHQADFDSAMLYGLLDSLGGEATYEGSVPDEKGGVETRIAELADQYDVVVTTGGTSVGEKDYTLRALADLGEVIFHRVRLRPGRPIAVARLPDHDAVAFAIPGKPIAAHTVATLVMRPFFADESENANARRPTIEATLARDVGIGEESFEYAVPVTLHDGGSEDSRGSEGSEGGSDSIDGPGSDGITAMPLGHVDSPLPVYAERFDPSVLSSSTRATRAEGVFLTGSGVEQGERVSVIPYRALE